MNRTYIIIFTGVGNAQNMIVREYRDIPIEQLEGIINMQQEEGWYIQEFQVIPSETVINTTNNYSIRELDLQS